MSRFNPRRLTFKHWAMPVYHKGPAMMAVVLHRAQRMSSIWKDNFIHRHIRSWETQTFIKATTP